MTNILRAVSVVLGFAVLAFCAQACGGSVEAPPSPTALVPYPDQCITVGHVENECTDTAGYTEYVFCEHPAHQAPCVPDNADPTGLTWCCTPEMVGR